MAIIKKLMRNGNSWALCINSVILKLLEVNPEEDMVKYMIDKDTLVIRKGDKIEKN